MPLVTCPDCGKRHSDAAPACPECGRPSAVVAPVAASPVERPHARGGIAHLLACPRCGSPEVRKLSLIYREGTIVREGSARGSAGHPAGSERSLLSLGAAPPAMRDSAAAAVLAGGLAAAALLVVGAATGLGFVIPVALAVILAAVIGVVVSQSSWNRHVYPGLVEQWDATFLCLRCDHRFVPGTADGGAIDGTAGLP